MGVKELIKFIDDKIQERKDKLAVEIVTEACLQKQQYPRHYDIDEFMDDSYKFIEKRLKHRF